MSYNGWSNHETWLVNVWLGDYLNQRADDGELITHEYIMLCVEDAMAEHIDGSHGLASDLISSVMSGINYRELAQHYIFAAGLGEER